MRQHRPNDSPEEATSVTRPTRVAACLLAIGLLLGALGVARPAPGSAQDVVITGTALQPPRITVALHGRVDLVNRSGQLVHVDFPGDAGQHHVFQVPGRIWAEFHRPGVHPFVVHLGASRRAELHGAVEVTSTPEGSSGLRTCRSINVMGVCLEP